MWVYPFDQLPSPSPPTRRPPPTAVRGLSPVPLSSLLFRNGDQLALWQRAENRVVLLAGGVTDFRLSADGQVLVILRASGRVINGVERYDLDLLTLKNGQERRLLSQIPRPTAWEVSPNGEWVVYSFAEGTLMALSTASEERPFVLGSCQVREGENCLGLAWAPHSRSLVWSDERGLWLAEMGSAEATLLREALVQVSDPQGVENTYPAAFSDLRWSQEGRFLLTAVAPRGSPVHWQAVVDLRSGRLAALEDSYNLDGYEATAHWLDAERLLVAGASQLKEGKAPFIHIWRVLATRPTLLSSLQHIDLYSEEFPTDPAASKSLPTHCLSWVQPAGAGKVWLGVRLEGGQAPPVLFQLDLNTWRLTKWLTLPLQTEQVIYAPDGSGAIIVTATGEVYFAAQGMSELDNLALALGDAIEQVVWLPAQVVR